VVELIAEICPVLITDIKTIEDNFQMITAFWTCLMRELKLEGGRINWFLLDYFETFVKDILRK
jgi:hypothetical protein